MTDNQTSFWAIKDGTNVYETGPTGSGGGGTGNGFTDQPVKYKGPLTSATETISEIELAENALIEYTADSSLTDTEIEITIPDLPQPNAVRFLQLTIDSSKLWTRLFDEQGVKMFEFHNTGTGTYHFLFQLNYGGAGNLLSVVETRYLYNQFVPQTRESAFYPSPGVTTSIDNVGNYLQVWQSCNSSKLSAKQEFDNSNTAQPWGQFDWGIELADNGQHYNVHLNFAPNDLKLSYYNGSRATLSNQSILTKGDADALYGGSTGLPPVPTTDGSYALKCTVVSGTPTYTWELITP